MSANDALVGAGLLKLLDQCSLDSLDLSIQFHFCCWRSCSSNEVQSLEFLELSFPGHGRRGVVTSL